jgi:hypothetical protein
MLTDRAPGAEIISFQPAQEKSTERRFER